MERPTTTTTTLLERLRQRKVVVRFVNLSGPDEKEFKAVLINEYRSESPATIENPSTPEEAKFKARLIAEHRSEFPATIRRVIESALMARNNNNNNGAKEEEDCPLEPESLPEDSFRFLSEVYEAVKDFFLPHRSDAVETSEETEITTDGSNFSSASSSSSGEGLLPRDEEHDREAETTTTAAAAAAENAMTADEVEVALRCFPMIFSEPFSGMLFSDSFPGITFFRILPAIACLFGRADGVVWIPLAVQLYAEWKVWERFLPLYDIAKQLLVPGKQTFVELFTNDNRMKGGTAVLLAADGPLSPFRREPDDPQTKSDNHRKLDEASLAVLARMGEMGFVKKKDGQRLKWLLKKGTQREDRLEFVEQRLKLLIDWDPSLLKVCCTRDAPLDAAFYRPPPHEEHHEECYASLMNVSRTRTRNRDTPLVAAFYRYCSQKNDNEEKGLRLGLFERIVERGMLYYPNDLGFVFHALAGNRSRYYPNDVVGTGVPYTAFRHHSFHHGTETVTAIVRRQLLGGGGGSEKFRHRRSIRSLVVAAASNERIVLDGVYFLVRADPSALIPDPERGT